MKIRELIKDIETVKVIGDLDTEISSISADSKKVVDNGLFICLKGENCDGHEYIKEAVSYGARAILCEKECDTTAIQIIVKNARKVFSKICSNFYGNPEKRLKIVGVCGTNGKTTVTFMIAHVLNSYGFNCGIVGTLGIRYNEVIKNVDLTTPDPTDLFSALKEMADSGITVVIMEVSAHASALFKTDAIDFYLGIFTNFTEDHLDYFKTMENYKNAKLRFFNSSRCKYLIANSDDEVGRQIINNNEKVFSFGLENPADAFAVKIKESKDGESFFINIFDTVAEVKLKIFGKFNVCNALASLEACVILGIPADFAVSSINSFNGVDGRLEKIDGNDFSVFIDYAHTPDGLLKSILAVKKLTDKRLICVFGCGGNRDSIKRKEMGKISANNADFTIITSDNPRFEEPMSIIKSIEDGVIENGGDFVSIEDRALAIEYALKLAKKGDAVLIAGKGCEKYQEILGVKHPFDDREKVNEILGVK